MEPRFNLNHICWVCLQQSENMMDVSYQQTEKTSFYEVLKYLLNEECLKENFIKLMCSKCVAEARTTYIFKQKCEKSWEFIFRGIGGSRPNPNSAHFITEDEEEINLDLDYGCGQAAGEDSGNYFKAEETQVTVPPPEYPVKERRPSDDDVVCIDDEEDEKPIQGAPVVNNFLGRQRDANGAAEHQMWGAQCASCGLLNLYKGTAPESCSNCGTFFVGTTAEPRQPQKVVTNYMCSTCKQAFSSLHAVTEHIVTYRNVSCRPVYPNKPSTLPIRPKQTGKEPSILEQLLSLEVTKPPPRQPVAPAQRKYVPREGS